MVEFFFERKTVFSLVQILEGSRECHEMPEMRPRKDIFWRKGGSSLHGFPVIVLLKM